MDSYIPDYAPLSGTAGAFHSSSSPAAQDPDPTPTPIPAYPQNPAISKKRKPRSPKPKNTHKCPWTGCDRWLSCPHNVRQHIREAHTDERPYACELCDKAFNRPYVLYRHLDLKHGVKRAGPGRGRGGGLKRAEIRVAEADESVVEETRPEPGALRFEVDNFAPRPTACRCGARFDNREALLAHLHDVHGEANSPLCNCMVCLGLSGGEGSVDAADVHGNEVGAAVGLRGLMADDLFVVADEGGVPGDSGEAVPGLGVDQTLPAMGKSQEHFAADMHGKLAQAEQPVDGHVPFELAGDAVGGVVETEFDDLDAWLKSAEEVFGVDAAFPGFDDGMGMGMN